MQLSQPKQHVYARKVRKRLGLTQQELAERFNVSLDTISAIGTGQRIPIRGTPKRCLKILDRSPEKNRTSRRFITAQTLSQKNAILQFSLTCSPAPTTLSWNQTRRAYTEILRLPNAFCCVSRDCGRHQ